MLCVARSESEDYHVPYWMRSGESLVPMAPGMLRRIFAETGPDFSAEICPGATLDDLDPSAIAESRNRWLIHSKNNALTTLPPDRLFSNAELMDNRGITYAALVLLGKTKGETPWPGSTGSGELAARAARRNGVAKRVVKRHAEGVEYTGQLDRSRGHGLSRLKWSAAWGVCHASGRTPAKHG